MPLKPRTPRKAVGTWALYDSVAVTVFPLLLTLAVGRVAVGDAGAPAVKKLVRNVVPFATLPSPVMLSAVATSGELAETAASVAASTAPCILVRAEVAMV